MIPTPDTGVPLDVKFISDIVSTVNRLEAAISTSAKSIAKIKNNAGEYDQILTSNSAFLADFATVNETVTAGKVLSRTIPFGNMFAVAPIVVITPQYVSGPKINTLVTITAVTTSKVDFDIAFTAAGTGVNMRFNAIAIGKPPGVQ